MLFSSKLSLNYVCHYVKLYVAVDSVVFCWLLQLLRGRAEQSLILAPYPVLKKSAVLKLLWDNSWMLDR